MLLFQYVFVQHIVICDVFMLVRSSFYKFNLFAAGSARHSESLMFAFIMVLRECKEKVNGITMHYEGHVCNLDDKVNAKYQKMGDTNCKERI